MLVVLLADMNFIRRKAGNSLSREESTSLEGISLDPKCCPGIKPRIIAFDSDLSIYINVYLVLGIEI